MGLDQTIKVTDPESTETDELVYFRKANFLHNWMHQLHCKKYGDIAAVDYNGVETELSRDDLLQLKKDVHDGNVKSVTGFFFGSQEISEYHLELVLKTIHEALGHISYGRIITYDSWW